MMNWAKQQLANVAGTQEPIYGPSAIKSVAEQAKATPYTELQRGDIKWAVMESTCVETQSFYMTADSGHIAMAQVIYSNVMGVRTTCMFNTKIYYPDNSQPFLWSSDSLSNIEFSDDKTSFYAENVASELSLDGKSYSIKSMNNEAASVNLTITQTAPGFVVGKDGKSLFGTDLSDPWGSISHSFWPRNTAEGTIVTKDGPIDFKGTAVLIHALQGMKPHHAAARWKSADFTGPTYSAVIVDFITPASYGSTKVTVGGIVKDGEIICAGSDCAASHPTTKLDSENEWPTPETARFEWKGTTKDGKPVQAVVEGPLGEQLDRVDVMAEVPGFVKSIIAGTVGTKPYIYQYHSKELTLKMKIGDEEITEKGSLFSEASFICE